MAGNLLQAERAIKVSVDVAARLLNLARLRALLLRRAAFAGSIPGFSGSIDRIEKLDSFAVGPAAGTARAADNACRFDSIDKGPVSLGVAGQNLCPSIVGVDCAQHFYYLLHANVEEFGKLGLSADCGQS